MKTPTSVRGIVKTTALAYMLVMAGVAGIVNGCSKKTATSTAATSKTLVTAANNDQQGTKQGMVNGERYQTLTSTLTVADVKENGGNTEVIFNENTEFFKVKDATLAATLKQALAAGTAMQVTFDPWKETVLSATAATGASATATRRGEAEDGRNGAKKVNLATMPAEQFDEPSALGVMNATTPGLNNVIPDFATAQLMFEYISKQCCQVPGPYGVDYCIPFQYCIDGCYARAHKMCYIINKKYRYGTQKVFSFANTGIDKLCVQGQKWGGCCIRWWYHVAPLVTIQTTQGPKAYVFDPAMFDQPVLLSAWLHAQENPVCEPTGYVAHVSMINVRPTSAYTPAGSSGLTFTTDPSYTATNNTLFNYRYLTTCP